MNESGKLSSPTTQKHTSPSVKISHYKNSFHKRAKEYTKFFGKNFAQRLFAVARASLFYGTILCVTFSCVALRKRLLFQKTLRARRREHRNFRALKYPCFLGQQSLKRGKIGLPFNFATAKLMVRCFLRQ